VIPKVDPIWNEPVSAGNAGALARYVRKARIRYIVNKLEIERAAHAVRTRAPALPGFACLFLTPVLGHDRVQCFQLRICQTERISLTNVTRFVALTKPTQALLGRAVRE